MDVGVLVKSLYVVLARAIGLCMTIVQGRLFYIKLFYYPNFPRGWYLFLFVTMYKE